MAKYNPNFYYTVAGMKMHPVGEVIGEAAVYGAVGAFAVYFAASLIPGVAPALMAVAPVANVAGKVIFVKKIFNIVYKNRKTISKFFSNNLKVAF